MFAEPFESENLPRRRALQRIACGFGSLGLLGVLHGEQQAARAPSLLPGRCHHPARASRVIFVFLHGGLSHVDSFDPKPKLDELDGQPVPIEKPKFNFAETGKLLKSPWKFQHYGESGIEVSDLFPHLGAAIDSVCVVRSMNGNQVAHGGASLLLHTGDGVLIRPSMGAWVLYGLGTENQNLPGFITLSPSSYHGGAQNYGAAFLPAIFQGTRIGDGNTAPTTARMSNLEPAENNSSLQRLQLDMLRRQNERAMEHEGHDARLEARIKSFELAFRMQMAAPEVMDASGETAETESLYGIGEKPTEDFGRQCLLARRLSEAGVRFVQVNHSYPRNYWDAHGGLRENHQTNAKKVDKPIAGLIRDLERRGLLDETLVILGTEFGRTPAAQGKDGRDHHPHAFTMCLAGGGVRGGTIYGATDEFGYYVTENKVPLRDLHATVLHLLGIDHEALIYRYSGRDFRLTDVEGSVLHNVIAT